MESEIVLSGPYGQRQLGSLHLLLHCGMEVLVPGPVLCLFAWRLGLGFLW